MVIKFENGINLLNFIDWSWVSKFLFYCRKISINELGYIPFFEKDLNDRQKWEHVFTAVKKDEEDSDGDGEMCCAVVRVHELNEPLIWKEQLLD